MLAEQHLTVYVDKQLKAKVKKKVYDSENTPDKLSLKECVAAGLILILNKREHEIKNIIKRYSNEGVKK